MKNADGSTVDGTDAGWFPPGSRGFNQLRYRMILPRGGLDRHEAVSSRPILNDNLLP